MPLHGNGDELLLFLGRRPFIDCRNEDVGDGNVRHALAWKRHVAIDARQYKDRDEDADGNAELDGIIGKQHRLLLRGDPLGIRYNRNPILKCAVAVNHEAVTGLQTGGQNHLLPNDLIDSHNL